MAHDAKVVGDEQVAEPEPVLEHLEQVDDLRLDRYVQRRDRLVGDDQLGPDGQGAGDADALSLAAAELMGIPARVRGIQAHRFEQVGHAVSPFPPRAQSVHGERFPEQRTHGHARIEGAVGILEDDLHLASQPPEIAFPQGKDLVGLSFLAVLQGGMEHGRSRGRIDQTQNGPPNRGLAAPAFAHQAQRFAPLERKVDAVHGLDHRPVTPQQSASHGEVFLQALDLQQGFMRICHTTHSLSPSPPA